MKALPILVIALGLPTVCAAQTSTAAELPRSRTVIVGIDDRLTTCLATVFDSGAWEEGEQTLDAVLRRTGVERIEPLFRAAPAQLALRAGRTRIPVAELRAFHQQRSLASKRAVTEDTPALHHIYRLRLPDVAAADTAVAELRASPWVQFAEPAGYLSTDALPNDTYADPQGSGTWRSGSWAQSYSDLWGLETAGWRQVWEDKTAIWSDPLREGGGGVVVAIIDTGVDYNHPDLATNIWRDSEGNPGADLVDTVPSDFEAAGWVLSPAEDYVQPDADPRDIVGHGTLVAGVVGAVADNQRGIAGVAWQSTILPVRAGFLLLTQQGGVAGLFESDDLAEAIVWAADHGADIINLSLGSDTDSTTIGLALDYAVSLGVLPIAAAGNDALPRVNFPARHPGVLAVGALGPHGNHAGFSNWGYGIEVAAPGVDVLSLKANGAALATPQGTVGSQYLRASGTSMAAPFVAGAAALVLSAKPGTPPQDLAGMVLSTAEPLPFDLPTPVGRATQAGAGRLSLRSALDAGPPEAWAGIYTVGVDIGPQSGGNGNLVLEPGETGLVHVNFENFWRNRGNTTVRLETTDPALVLEQDTANIGAFSTGSFRGAGFVARASHDVPPRHRVAAMLEFSGTGYLQDVPVELFLNEPVPTPLALGRGNILELEPVAAADQAGNVVVVWRRFDLSTQEVVAVGQLIDSDGLPQGDEFLVPIPEGGYFINLAVTRAATGPFLVSWLRYPDGGGALVEALRFDADATPVGPVLVANLNPIFGLNAGDAAIDSNGRIAISWTEFPPGSPTVVRARYFDASGLPLGLPFQVHEGSGEYSGPDLAFRSDDSLVVAWRHYEEQGSIHARMRLFDPNGAPVGPSFRVNQQPGRFALDPRLAISNNDQILVAWDHCEGPEGPCSIRGRVFDESTVPQSGELTLGSDPGRWVDDFAIGADHQGNWAAAWGSCDLEAIFLLNCSYSLRTFDSGGGPLEPAYRVPIAGEALRPSIVGAERGFWTFWERYNSGGTTDGVYQARVELPADTRPCVQSALTHCLADGRFEVSATWKAHDATTGVGSTVPLTSDSGAFWFFSPDNVEVLIKVLDGTGLNGHFWVFFGALSNVEYTIEVRDTHTGQRRSYFNPAGQLASRADIEAFAQAAPGGAVAQGSSSPLPSKNLALLGGRFSVEVDWTTPDGQSGVGTATPIGDRTGIFWFFQPSNLELVVKALDGRALNGHYWIFFGALSNVAYTVTVTDTVTGAVRQYHNPQGRMASVADVVAFPDAD